MAPLLWKVLHIAMIAEMCDDYRHRMWPLLVITHRFEDLMNELITSVS